MRKLRANKNNNAQNNTKNEDGEEDANTSRD